jgi:NADH-quinone oxidoreductase subunit A
MLLEYIAIAVMIAVATLIAFIAIGLGELFGPKKKSEAKDMPYESGMNPYGEGTRRMPVRFYLIAVLVHPLRYRSGVLFAVGDRLSSIGYCLA